jgi:hypothetical protein
MQEVNLAAGSSQPITSLLLLILNYKAGGCKLLAYEIYCLLLVNMLIFNLDLFSGWTESRESKKLLKLAIIFRYRRLFFN